MSLILVSFVPDFFLFDAYNDFFFKEQNNWFVYKKKTNSMKFSVNWISLITHESFYKTPLKEKIS